MTDITKLAQSLKAAAENAIGAHERLAAYPYGEIIDISQYEGEQIDIDITDINEFHEEANPVNVLALVEALVEALDKAQRRNAELEAQNDYFASLVAMARVSADKAIRKFPQPNYVLLKVAEEAGEVVQAGVHYAENRMEWGQVEGEIVQLLAMLIRLVTEGDQVNGITPPASCCAGIKVEAE
ncbi:ead/Ea22-like family protein [Klebsiella michiganensis]|uniref:ead/Ea22-like family protein n=1 Tax=Klebsiella michiganensis TaxID=1134687 RepID=UPI003862AA53